MDVYRDRAQERRDKFGEDASTKFIQDENQEKREAETQNQAILQEIASRVDKPIGSTNVGHQLLERMGWKSGQGLGKRGTGRIEPVVPKGVPDGERSGLGSVTHLTAGITVGNNKKEEIQKRVQARYDSIQS